MQQGERKSLRFPPDKSPLAWVDPYAHASREGFKPRLPVLLVDEARDGCGVVSLYHDNLMEGAVIWIQIAALAPMRAEIRWIKDLDESALKLGLMYLD